MTQDHYEILQVHPRADAEAIKAAYQRLRDLYDPVRLDGAADELVDLARQKRDLIERAYAVLSDPVRRAAYDQEQAALAPTTDDQRPTTNDQRPTRSALRPSGRPLDVGLGQEEEVLLDYRPLPPARRAERPRHFDAQPVLEAGPPKPNRRLAPRGLSAPIMVAGLLAIIAAISLVVTQQAAPTSAPVTPTPSALDQFEPLIPTAQRAAQQNTADAQAWIDYGNLLYNSAEIVRENAPDSPLYQQRLPRWLQATEAYSRALALQPHNPDVRADLGASSCFYGAGAGDQRYARSGAAEARRAAQAAPDNPRVLLSLGHCLVSIQPPQTEEAIASWRRVVQLSPPDSPLAAQAQGLIAHYSK